jgi:hypothetical protein
MKKSKPEIITFKADEKLSQALSAVGNRSEFIRNALFAALDNVCPLCSGTGVLNQDRKRHWDEFSRDHALSRCDDCQELRLVCQKGQAGS